jgi:hypothetical protein
MSDLSAAEMAFARLGLNTALSRTAATFAIVTGAIMYIKPAMMYYPDGTPIPWSSFSPSGEGDLAGPPSDRNTTPVPWWMPGLAAAGAVWYIF